MTGDKLLDAMEHIDADLIEAADALPKKRRRKAYWFAAIAAVLAVVFGIGLLINPLTINSYAVSTAKYPKYKRTHYKEMRATTEALSDYFKESMLQTLSDSGNENVAYSPINLYLALCLSAELTGGDSQILNLLGAESLEALRDQANEVWNACYYDDGNQTLLANSLWLDESLRYDKAVMNRLAKDYYTSVFQGNLGSDGINRAIQAWLNEQTNGLLKQESGNVSLDQSIVMALYSTVYFQAKWGTGYSGSYFSKEDNTKDTFHSPVGDITCTYMHRDKIQTNYCFGEDFGAIALNLKDGSRMWFILPDEGKTVDDVLIRGEYAHFLFSQSYIEDLENRKYMKVNLSLPKFDVRSSGDLKEDLQSMGITNIFDPKNSGLSHSVTGEMDVWFTAVNQATRVAIDEEGVTAASYIEIPGAGAPMPPEEIIDFILNRPFLFVITNQYSLPLFAGVINEP